MDSLIARLETLRPLCQEFELLLLDASGEVTTATEAVALQLEAHTLRGSQFDLYFHFTNQELLFDGMYYTEYDFAVLTPKRLRLLYDVADLLPCCYLFTEGEYTDRLFHRLMRCAQEVVAGKPLLPLQRQFEYLTAELRRRLTVPSLLAYAYRQHPRLILGSLTSHPALQDYVFTVERERYLRRRYEWRLAQGVLLKAIGTERKQVRITNKALLTVRQLVQPPARDSFGFPIRFSPLNISLQHKTSKEKIKLTASRTYEGLYVITKNSLISPYLTRHPWYLFLFLHRIYQEYKSAW